MRTSVKNKPTIRRYIEYLESAFLIVKVSTVDDNCRTMKRERNFKTYLSNPSMHAALFAPVTAEESDKIGRLAESAVFSQFQHSSSFKNLKYARWRNEGEVDIVFLSGGKPDWIGEIKWSDQIDGHWNDDTKALGALLRRHKSIKSSFLTTKTIDRETTLENRDLRIIPTAAYCYVVGLNIASSLNFPMINTLNEPQDSH